MGKKKGGKCITPNFNSPALKALASTHSPTHQTNIDIDAATISALPTKKLNRGVKVPLHIFLESLDQNHHVTPSSVKLVKPNVSYSTTASSQALNHKASILTILSTNHPTAKIAPSTSTKTQTQSGLVNEVSPAQDGEQSLPVRALPPLDWLLYPNSIRDSRRNTVQKRTKRYSKRLKAGDYLKSKAKKDQLEKVWHKLNDVNGVAPLPPNWLEKDDKLKSPIATCFAGSVEHYELHLAQIFPASEEYTLDLGLWARAVGTLSNDDSESEIKRSSYLNMVPMELSFGNLMHMSEKGFIFLMTRPCLERLAHNAELVIYHRYAKTKTPFASYESVKLWETWADVCNPLIKFDTYHMNKAVALTMRDAGDPTLQVVPIFEYHMMLIDVEEGEGECFYRRVSSSQKPGKRRELWSWTHRTDPEDGKSILPHKVECLEFDRFNKPIVKESPEGESHNEATLYLPTDPIMTILVFWKMLYQIWQEGKYKFTDELIYLMHLANYVLELSEIVTPSDMWKASRPAELSSSYTLPAMPENINKSRREYKYTVERANQAKDDVDDVSSHNRNSKSRRGGKGGLGRSGKGKKQKDADDKRYGYPDIDFNGDCGNVYDIIEGYKKVDNTSDESGREENYLDSFGVPSTMFSNTAIDGYSSQESEESESESDYTDNGTYERSSDSQRVEPRLSSEAYRIAMQQGPKVKSETTWSFTGGEVICKHELVLDTIGALEWHCDDAIRSKQDAFSSLVDEVGLRLALKKVREAPLDDDDHRHAYCKSVLPRYQASIGTCYPDYLCSEQSGLVNAMMDALGKDYPTDRTSPISNKDPVINAWREKVVAIPPVSAFSEAIQ